MSSVSTSTCWVHDIFLIPKLPQRRKYRNLTLLWAELICAPAPDGSFFAIGPNNIFSWAKCKSQTILADNVVLHSFTYFRASCLWAIKVKIIFPAYQYHIQHINSVEELPYSDSVYSSSYSEKFFIDSILFQVNGFLNY